MDSLSFPSRPLQKPRVRRSRGDFYLCLSFFHFFLSFSSIVSSAMPCSTDSTAFNSLFFFSLVTTETRFARTRISRFPSVDPESITHAAQSTVSGCPARKNQKSSRLDQHRARSRSPARLTDLPSYRRPIN